jgi:hypothetical protein
MDRLTMLWIVCAVPQGTVLFSTRMAPGLIDFAIEMTARSKAAKFVAAPAPMPLLLVGVFTLTKTTSAAAIHPLTSVENERFGDLAGM